VEGDFEFELSETMEENLDVRLGISPEPLYGATTNGLKTLTGMNRIRDNDIKVTKTIFNLAFFLISMPQVAENTSFLQPNYSAP
jgi:hypothetical protein